MSHQPDQALSTPGGDEPKVTPPSAALAFASLPANIPGNPTPFILQIPPSEVDLLPKLAGLANLGPESWYNTHGTPSAGHLGITRTWLSNATSTWINDFSWRSHEAYHNSFPNYRINVTTPSDNQIFDLHFAALFSKNPDAVPIIFMHGWPGSWTEFAPMMELLVKKYTSETLPYHVVVPSIPDYGLSTRPGEVETELDMAKAAEALNQLMVALGFGERGYIAQGGDVGYFLARSMAGMFDECKAFHLNMFFLSAEELEAVKHLPPTPEELVQLGSSRAWATTGAAYALEHGTRPSTLGLALMTSPVAMLAWMGEKFIEWSDNRDPSYSLPVDTILAQVAFYWYTKSFARSLWAYRSLTTSIGSPLPTMPMSKTKPFGYSWFPVEIGSLPQTWAESLFPNLVFHKKHERGGHFAALQEPAGFLEDVEEFVAIVKGKGVF